MDIGDLAGEALLQHRALFVLDVGGDHARAFGDEQFDRAQPDPRCGAGDHRHLAVQTPRHVSLPICFYMISDN
jgi:hypothetical protein